MGRPRRKRNGKLSLSPMQYEQAVSAFLKVKPEPKKNQAKKKIKG
jgi:hypothetical protein